MHRKPKKDRHRELAARVAALGERAEKEADAGAQAQINSIAATLGVRWDGSDWVALPNRRAKDRG